MVLGYVNVDQALDAVFANGYDERNRVCLGNGTGGFTCNDVSPDSFNSEAMTLGDVDGDQMLDAVFGNGSGQINRVCLGDGNGSFTCSDIGTAQSHSYGVALGYVDEPQVIFIDGFDTGDCSNWSAEVP